DPGDGDPANQRGVADGTLTPRGPVARAVCSLPRPWLTRIWRGYHPDRSGELQILPELPNFVGAGLPHVGPWSYTSDVPMLWYGPGHIKALGTAQRDVTVADIAPTIAELLGFEFDAPDGKPLRGALVPRDQRPRPPRLVVVNIWDGAGRDVLEEWPEDWPNLRSLMPRGAWYDRATVGSSPTSSAQIHGTIGTGAFPKTHGLVGHSMRVDGKIVAPWKNGPGLLMVPTLADLYDRAMDNRPLVATSGTVAIQLGMMGHGAAFQGGDKDMAVLRVPGTAETLGAEGVRWNLPEPLTRFFSYPGYANSLPPLSRYVQRELDLRDGRRDGKWRGHDLDAEQLLGGFYTPARIPYQTRLVEEMIEREGFGADDVPDLLFINNKLIDQLGHIYSYNSLEIKDSVRAQDEALPTLIEVLDREVGRGNWAMVVTADHGSTPSPRVSGAFQISAGELHGAVKERFDPDGDDVEVIEQVKQTEVFMNVEELAEHGYSLEDVARFVMTLRQRDVPIPGNPVPRPNAKVFRAAWPADAMRTLSCMEEIRSANP
ncbi:MAG TPA: alkaline phosphatase family protein, partial [Actinomycetota bacterium]|nr:alkaline phosphatase family protein [Actinomycetota bacterium]